MDWWHRMRTALLLVALLLVPVVLGATDPGRRSEPELTTTGQATALAMARDSGWIAAGSRDPGGRVVSDGGTPPTFDSRPDEDVWFLWNQRGILQIFDDADRAGCIDELDDLQQEQQEAEGATGNCVGHVVDVDISADGRKLVVGSDVGGGDSEVLLIDQAGSIRRLSYRSEGQIPAAIVSVAIDDSADRVQVLLDRSTVQQDRATVYRYTWSNVDRPQYAQNLTGVPAAMDMSEDNKWVIVGAGAHHRIQADSGSVLTSPKPGSSAEATAVAVSDQFPYWSIAAYTRGSLTVHNEQEAERIAFQKRTSLVDQTAVAITATGSHAVAGDAAGVIRLYKLSTTDPDKMQQVGNSVTLGDHITSLAFSGDGKYLAAGAQGGQIGLYRVAADGLGRIFTDKMEGAVVDVATDLHGERLAAAAGKIVSVYEAKHDIRAVLPSDLEFKPGERRALLVGLRNDGNRDEVLDVDVTWPDGLAIFRDDEPISIPAGGKGELALDIVTEELLAPGTYTALINYTLERGGTKSVQLPIKVPVIDKWSVSASGATSQSIQAGGFASFPLNVKNEGNAAKDAKVVATVDKSGWIVTAAPNPVRITPGGSQTIHVDLRAPEGAPELAVAKVTVILDNDRDQTLELTATVDASFQPGLEGPNNIQVNRGAVAEFNVTLRNDGNAVDSFQMSASNVPPGWALLIQDEPDRTRVIDVDPLEERRLRVQVQAPSNAEESITIPILLKAQSEADPTRTASKTILVGLVLPAVDETEPDNGTPVGVAVALLAVVAAVALGRRRL